jgi:PKD repeat protein
MKRTKFYFWGLAVLAVIGIMAVSCGKEEETPAPTVQINFSVDGYQVAFTALVTNANTFAWDFGDGETSTEQNPVHTYAMSGKYTVTLSVTGDGGSADASTEVEIAASKYEMLTGGSAATNGKSWQFSQQAGEGDALTKADQDFTVEDAIPSGMLGLIGLPADEYQDEFIFHNDGSYGHVVVNDSVITDAIYAIINQLDFHPSPGEEVIGLTKFDPVSNATFTFTEGEDLSLEVTSDEYNDSTWTVTWSNVDYFEIKDGETFGILDFTRKYLVFDIGTDHMQVGMFISATDGSKANYPSHMVKMTFVPKAD